MNGTHQIISSRSPGRPKNDLAPTGGGSDRRAEPGAQLIARPSRALRAVLLVAHGLAAWAVLLADLDGWYRGPMLAAIVLSAAWTLRRGDDAHRLRCDKDGGLAVDSGGGWRNAALLADSTVLPWLVVLRYRLDGARLARTCVILPDSLAREDFRRLRVWLRWRGKVEGGHPATTDPARAEDGTT